MPLSLSLSLSLTGLEAFNSAPFLLLLLAEHALLTQYVYAHWACSFELSGTPYLYCANSHRVTEQGQYSIDGASKRGHMPCHAFSVDTEDLVQTNDQTIG